MTIHFHAGSNTPGYLSEDDEPFAFADFGSAKSYVIEELDRAGDHIFDAGEDEDERAIADEYSAAMEELNLDNGPTWDVFLPTSTSEHDLGRHWWIVQCDEPECGDDDDDDPTPPANEPDGYCCVDCLCLLANGDVPEHMDDVQRSEWLAEIDRRTAGYDVVPACQEDCEGHFSWSSCDVCGSTLGGDRHPVSMIRRTGSLLEEIRQAERVLGAE